MRPAKNDVGSILIVSLWVVALLALLAAGVTTRTRFAVRQEAWRDLEIEGSALLDGLAAAAVARLKTDTNPDFDAYTEEWGRRFEARASDFAADGRNLPNHWTDTKVRILAIDESGKININFAPEALLDALIKETGHAGNPDLLVSAILDWRDPDGLGFAEADFYGGMNPPYSPANSDFLRIEELLYVEGVTPESFFGEDANHNGRLDPTEDDGDLFLPNDNADGILQPGLRALCTVYGDGVINVNGVSETVLRAILNVVLPRAESDTKATQLIRRRQGRDSVDGTEDDRPLTSEAELIEALGESVYDRLLSADIEMGVTSKAVRFVVQVENLPRHFRRTADFIALREDDAVRVVDWHEHR